MKKPEDKPALNFNDLQIKPLARDTWSAFEELFGSKGACAGCWCMFWHLKRSEYDAARGDGTHQMMFSRVENGETPGLLAFIGDKAIGWVTVEPRTSYQALERSRSLAAIDDLPVWSIPCFFVDKKYRKQGLNSWLITQAAEYAFQNGAPAVEGYPVEFSTGKTSDVFIFTGTKSAFVRAGFSEVARPSTTKFIMRKQKLR